MNWLKYQDHQRDVMALRWYYVYKCCCYTNDHLRFFVWGWTKVKLLRRMLRSRGIRTGLHGVEVNSVDGFQGREKEARFWRISGEVQYPPFNATEKQMAWKFTWNYILFWGVRWWWCVTFMCGDAELLTLGLDQPLWVQVIMIGTVRSNLENATGFVRDWRRINVAMTRAKSLPPRTSVAKGVQHEQLDLLNKNSSQSWDGEKLVNTK